MSFGNVERFDAFMRRALYEPVSGYYTSGRDPFGARGDFFTASQVQPTFGQIIAREAERVAPGARVFELGPGRGEMRAFFGDRYAGIGPGETLPSGMEGLVFANEFFDALPVRAGLKKNGALRELFVSYRTGTPRFEMGPELEQEPAAWVERYWPYLQDGNAFEICEDGMRWIQKIAAGLSNGLILAIDYGYRSAETRRFPDGTLMSYSRHVALTDVLDGAGRRDLTAHVCFDALMDTARDAGMRVVRFETLRAVVIRAMESDPEWAMKLDRGQLKTILYGLGETFYCMEARKDGEA